jgi:glycosyltransferase involved in cell wall biosynthesis
MKTVGLYDPYLPILGGAERYILTIAACLKKDYKTIVYTENERLLSHAQQKFGIDISGIECRPWPANSSSRQKELADLDLFFYITDGSIFSSPARKNVLIIQTPLHIPKHNLLNRYKLRSLKSLICYSDFMAKLIHQKLKRSAEVLFVPVEETAYPSIKREKMIISVGRFFTHLHNKKQLEMVAAFKQLIAMADSDLKLYLVGSVDPGSEAYLKQVEEAAHGYRIRILTHASYADLSQLYSRSLIYWHATGFGEDLVKHPERAEHFGVSTLEAMSYGAIPVVFAGGGQLEIVKSNVNGFLWHSQAELIAETKQIVTDEQLRQSLSHQAYHDAQEYSVRKFCAKLYGICQI